jgi:hypothetical protein
MAERSSQGGSSAVLLSAMAGAVLGAAGLAFWLLSEADRRRQSSGRRAAAEGSTTAAGSGYPTPDAPAPRPLPERDLHDKVHELNQAIDDVRRQLESMSTGS